MDIHDKMNLILHWNLMKTSPNVVDNIMCIFEDYKDGFAATIYPTQCDIAVLLLRFTETFFESSKETCI